MIEFIQRSDNPEIPPPYKFPGVTIMSFQLPAKPERLQALCDDMLNIGLLEDRGFEYRAFTNFVDMEIVTYPRMMFDEPPFDGWGYASQQEIYFRFYVWKFVSIWGVSFPEPWPEFFFPFIFVDNPWSMTSGRNVIGFPKVMAKFDPIAVLGVDPLRITVSAMVMKTHSPQTKLDWAPIVEIEPVAAAAAAAVQAPQDAWPWAGLGARARSALGSLASDAHLDESLQMLLADFPQFFTTVQLKQFRNLPTDACFQAVVNTPFMPENVQIPKLLPPVTITVNKYASLDIPGSLGFDAGKKLHPSLRYQVSLDMSMSHGENIFVNR
jgi:acetoacetate decarboxylase